MRIIANLLFLTTFLFPRSLCAEDVEKAASILGLKLPVQVDMSHMYADGGTLGMLFTDADGRLLKLCYDGRKDLRERNPGHKFHLFLGGFHPTNPGTVEVPICSAQEKAILQIVVEWVNKNYPEDWRDTKKYANTGYVARMIDDLTERSCR